MSEFGVDLAAWYADGRVDALIDFIDELPGASRFYEAVSNDPDQARLLAEHRLTNTEKSEWRPRVSEFDTTAQLLQMLVNEIKALRRVTIASGGGKPGQEKPVLGPRTAVDEAFELLEDALSGELLSQFGFGPEDF